MRHCYATWILFGMLACCLLLSGCDSRSIVQGETIYDMKSEAIYPGVYAQGLGSMEKTVGSNTLGEWVWGYGPKTSFQFISQSAEQAFLVVSFSNPIPGQNIEVNLNGNVVTEIKNIPSSRWLQSSLRKKIPLSLEPGVNSLEIRYGSWNGFNAVVSDVDSRHFAVAFLDLRIYREPHQK